MNQSPQAGTAMNATAARNALFALVKSAEKDGITTPIHKRNEHVLLAPLDRFPAARNPAGLPCHSLSAAQSDWGDLVSRAAKGDPQVLLRGSTPVAVLLPAAPDRDRARRRLATLGDASAELASGPASTLSFGLPGLDAATGGLQAGRLTLVAAPPSVGGSLLGLAAARKTALDAGREVLYAASGPNRADIFRRILAAESGGEYPRLKQGRLTEYEQRVEQQLRHKNHVLFIDDGSDLTAEDIAETAPHMNALALVVVDRLQAAHSARLPLSGDRLPAASQVLAGLARTMNIPVLAVVDSDRPALLNVLDADVVVTLAVTADPSKIQVSVTERDFGSIGSAVLRPDLLHARFLDAPSARGTELAQAALPYTSGAHQGLPAEATRVLAALRTAVGDGDDTAVDSLGAILVHAFTSVTQLPDTSEGHRLADALRDHDPALRAYCPALNTDLAGADGQRALDGQQAVPGPTGENAEQTRDDADQQDEGDGLAPGDEEDEPEGHIFPALVILKAAVKRSKMHPIPVIAMKERDSGPWPLITEHMDGEPGWIHPDVTATRVAHVRANGKRFRRDQLDVPESFGEGVLCLIDRNGSFPSACSGVPLAPNKLLHTGPLGAFDKTKAGIYLIDIPLWNRSDMPHPLGRVIEKPDEQGRVWVTTPHIKQLERLVRESHLDVMPAIHDSWTGKANESLFKPFYVAAREARSGLVQTGGDPYKAYKTRLSIALRLLWPKRVGQKSPFWRPDWRMSMVAEASVRHWTVAFKAVQEGHTLLALRNCDQAIFWTPPGTPPSTYRIGTGFGEVKSKFVQSGEFIPEGDD